MKLQTDLPHCYIEPFSPQNHAAFPSVTSQATGNLQAEKDDMKLMDGYLQRLTGGEASTK